MLDKILDFIAELLSPQKATSSYLSSTGAIRGSAFWTKKGKTIRVLFHCYGSNIKINKALFRSPSGIPKPKQLTYGVAQYSVGSINASYEIAINTNGEIYQTLSDSTTSIMGAIEYEI